MEEKSGLHVARRGPALQQLPGCGLHAVLKRFAPLFFSFLSLPILLCLPGLAVAFAFLLVACGPSLRHPRHKTSLFCDARQGLFFGSPENGSPWRASNRAHGNRNLRCIANPAGFASCLLFPEPCPLLLSHSFMPSPRMQLKSPRPTRTP